MSIEINIKKEDDYLFVEYSGEYRGDLATLKIDDIKQACLQYKHPRLLVDITNCKLSVTTIDKYRFGVVIAKKFGFPKPIKTAMLVAPEQYDPFVRLIATNRGALYEIFIDKNEALNWLLE